MGSPKTSASSGTLSLASPNLGNAQGRGPSLPSPAMAPAASPGMPPQRLHTLEELGHTMPGVAVARGAPIIRRASPTVGTRPLSAAASQPHLRAATPPLVASQLQRSASQSSCHQRAAPEVEVLLLGDVAVALPAAPAGEAPLAEVRLLREGGGSRSCSPRAPDLRVGEVPRRGPEKVLGEETFARALREKDDEIVRLREQVRRGTAWAPKWSPGRMSEENTKLRREVAQLQELLQNARPHSATGPPGSEETTARPSGPSAGDSSMRNGVSSGAGSEAPTAQGAAVVSGACCEAAPSEGKPFWQETGRSALAEGGVSPARGSPRSALTARIMELQRELREREEDAQYVEENLRAQVARLEGRCEQLEQQQHRAALAEELAAIEQDLSLVCTGPGNGGTPLHENFKRIVERINLLTRDRQQLEEELKAAESRAGQQCNQFRYEREEWRRERETLLADHRRRDKTESDLRRQMAAVQERLDSMQLDATERARERHDFQTRLQEITEKSRAEREKHEAQHLGRSKQLEEQVAQQAQEVSRLHYEVQRLEGERAEACSRLARLQQQLAQQKLVPAAAAERAVERQHSGKGRGRGGRGLAAGGRRGAAAATNGHSDHVVISTCSDVAGVLSHAASASSLCSSDASSTGSSSVEATTRKRACSVNLSAVFGDAPLAQLPGVGWYFRLRIDSVSSGWVGGFGIGVTLSSPVALFSLPDRAARVPHAWLAGYWGRTFSNGHECASGWQPQSLRPGDEVGFLVDLAGECAVFVNDEERCRFADPPVPVGSLPNLELRALIDVAATATTVTFLNGAPPPPSVCPPPNDMLQAVGACAANGSPPAGAGQPGLQSLGVGGPTPTPTHQASAGPSPMAPPPSPSRGGSAVAGVTKPTSTTPARTKGSSPVPPLLALRTTAAMPPTSQHGPGPQVPPGQAATAVVAAVVQTAPSTAALAAIRRVPQLPLHLLAVR